MAAGADGPTIWAKTDAGKLVANITKLGIFHYNAAEKMAVATRTAALRALPYRLTVRLIAFSRQCVLSGAVWLLVR
jgi:hypothetical protein